MKAILILDNVDETEIAELRANVQLNLYGEDRGEYNNCSLKPMPNYKLNIIPNGAYARGWDDCLEEILGEEE